MTHYKCGKGKFSDDKRCPVEELCKYVGVQSYSHHQRKSNYLLRQNHQCAWNSLPAPFQVVKASTFKK